jgi:hypothetical protein
VPIVLKSGSLEIQEPSGPVQASNEIALHFFFSTSSYSRPLCTCSDCTAPISVVGMNYATEGHCAIMSLSILYIHIITCIQGFRIISFRAYFRIRKISRYRDAQLIHERQHGHRKISNYKMSSDILSVRWAFDDNVYERH